MRLTSLTVSLEFYANSYEYIQNFLINLEHSRKGEAIFN